MKRCQSLLLMVVVAAWAVSSVAIAQEPQPARPATGAQIYAKWCADCHSTSQGPGSMVLQRRYQGAVPAVLEERDGLNSQFVSLVVRRGVGFMPSFRKTEISDEELALVAQYLVSGPRSVPAGTAP